MSTISTGVGLISGLPIDELVNSLIAIHRRPIDQLQSRLGILVQRRTALLQVSAQLLSIQNAASRFDEPEFFQRTRVASSDESAILATAGSTASAGQYTFTVRNLASSHQLISGGFATADSTLVGPGTLTIETSEALLNRSTPLSALNDGAGVRAGKIRITDRAGDTAEIDLRSALTADEVVRAINLQTDAIVTARIQDDHLVLEDHTGLQTGQLSVSEVGAGHTAVDLGLMVQEADGVILGRSLVTLSADTRLVSLNDGNGVRTLAARDDVRIALADGTTLDYDFSARLTIDYRNNGDGTFTDLSTPLAVLNRGAGIPLGTISATNRAGQQVEIDFSSARTIRDITTAPEWAEADLTVTVSGSHLVITDESGGTGSIVIEDVDSTTAAALGIADSENGGTLTGDDVFFIETVGDVLRIINTHADNDDGAGGLKLQASISDNSPGLTLTDATSGGQLFRVEALNGSSAALDLGIVGRAAGDTIESRRLLAGLNTVLLGSLNGGRGVSRQLTTDTTLSALHRGVGIPPGQIRITTRDGTQVDVDLTAASTLADVKAAIESASSNLSVTLSGAHLVITDQSVPDGQTPTSDLIIEDLSAGATAAALGIAGSTSEDTLTGQDIYTDVGSIQLTDRSGTTALVDLSAAQTLAQVVAAINGADTEITASISDSGLGIELVDSSGGAGDLLIEDLPGSTTAADLNIAFTGPQETVASGNLQRQYVSSATLLSDLGGDGVSPGMFRITDSQGESTVVDLTQGNEVTLQDVIDEINSRGIGVTARINDTGDGLLLEDHAGGTGQLTVIEDGGTTARALGILGTAAEGRDFIDGSFETRISIDAGDTLDDVLAAIGDSGAPVNATIINDGTEARPYRLSLTSSTSGRDGWLALDVGSTGLSFDTLMEARDATVLFGSPEADAPLVLTSSTNTLEDAISGVRLELVGPSDQPVTITLTHDVESISADLSSFVSAFNSAISQIDDLTRFDPETESRAVLTGDSTVRRVRQRLVDLVNRTVSGLPPTMNRLSRVGITLSGGSSLQFDEQDFRAAIESDPDGVAELFTLQELDDDGKTVNAGLGAAIQDGIKQLIDGDSGLIPINEQAIQASEKLLNERIDQLELLSERRRQRLLAQFYAMESALARLQSQQTALAGLFASNPAIQNQF